MLYVQICGSVVICSEKLATHSGIDDMKRTKYTLDIIWHPFFLANIPEAVQEEAVVSVMYFHFRMLYISFLDRCRLRAVPFCLSGMPL